MRLQGFCGQAIIVAAIVSLEIPVVLAARPGETPRPGRVFGASVFSIDEILSRPLTAKSRWVAPAIVSGLRARRDGPSATTFTGST